MSIMDRMASTPEMLACFGDDALIAAALAFERALAAALAEHGVISIAAAAAISQACDGFDASGLGELAAHAGTLAIPLVARLRAAVPPGHAIAVHVGATSQDVADTALVLQLAPALALLDGELDAIADALAALARTYAHTAARGRTLMQPAEVITLGMRAASWMLAIDAAHARIDRERAGVSVVQLGGAVGSLAALGDRGPAIRTSVAERLGLRAGLAWHNQRDAIAGLGAAIGIAIGALGKLARDVAILMQPEIGELAEPEIEGRGGSSAMPGKRNPTGCQVALSAAIRAPGLVASLVAGLPQELERGLGGWQAEAPVLSELFAIAHGAARAIRIIVERLEIDGAVIAAHAGEPSPERDRAVTAASRFVQQAIASHGEARTLRSRA